MDKKATSTSRQNEQIDSGRRSLLLKGTAGLVATGAALPASWTRPVVDAVLLPAHAQTSAFDPLPVVDPVPPASGPVDTPDPVDPVDPVDPIDPVDPPVSTSSSTGGKVTPPVDTTDSSSSSSSSGSDSGSSGSSGSGGDSGDGSDPKTPPKSTAPA